MSALGTYSRTSSLARVLSQTFKESIGTISKISTTACLRQVDAGILCDIDGVLTRGKSAVSAASRAFELLHDENGDWRAPVLFLTNAGNSLKQKKANEISEILKRKVAPNEIVMSHTALRLYSNYFDKHVAICGHGPLKEIAKNLGFKNVSTIEEISAAFPWLDACKPKELVPSDTVPNKDFQKIDAIVLFGEPDRWEHSLQIIIDLLIQDGDPSKTPEQYLPIGASRSHLPVFACSSDLVWASSAPSPRIAHGSFLVCLEALYERMSGSKLVYSGLIGKPSPTTYTFALSQLNAIAGMKFGNKKPLKRVYCIGDNPEIDIYGANLYNLCLQSISDEAWQSVSQKIDSLVQHEHPCLFYGREADLTRPTQCSNDDSEERRWHRFIENSAAMPQLLRELVMRPPKRISPVTFESILVLTGVYQEHNRHRQTWHGRLNPCHQVHHDFPQLPNLCEPSFIAKDVEEAVRYILALEEGREVNVTRCCPFMDEVARSP